MGKEIVQQQFSHDDFILFRERLINQLKLLKHIIQQPNFGDEPLRLGAELELYLLNKHSKPLCCNEQVLTALNNPLFQYEINQYNIELNLPAVAMQGQPFQQLEASMLAQLSQLTKVNTELGIEQVAIGILPTLTSADLTQQNMTDQFRYKLLSKKLSSSRGQPFHIEIHGQEDIELDLTDVTAEGANTSFQVHMMVPPGEFEPVYNAALFSQPLVTAIAANSPFFLGKKAWAETRIALLKQTLDCRLPAAVQHKLPARVNLACGWLKQDAWQLYAEAVSLYPVLVPSLSEEVTTGLPHLAELNLHMGTVWSWNRPVYCRQGNGHIRIEFRALPAGPSCVDMIANAAFAIGLAYGLRHSMAEITAIMPFDFADYNFYRAAQSGLDAEVMWPDLAQYKMVAQPLSTMIKQYLPIAKQGLLELKITATEADYYLGIIEKRLSQKVTGSVWQLNTAQHFEQNKHMSRPDSCQKMLQRYMQFSQANLPVSEWERLWQFN